MPRARDENHELTIRFERGWFIAACTCGKWSDMGKSTNDLADDWAGHMIKIGKLKPVVTPSESRAAVHTGPES